MANSSDPASDPASDPTSDAASDPASDPTSDAASDAAPDPAFDARIYDELRTLAHRQMADESVGRTLQPTALLHEAWIRLSNGRHEGLPADGVAFRARAATVMRRVRIDVARQRRAKRRDVARRVSLCDVPTDDEFAVRDDYIVALDAALLRLDQEDAELARIVELKFFGCCEIDEIAAHLTMSPRTVKRRWLLAKGWLHREITRAVNGEGR